MKWNCLNFLNSFGNLVNRHQMWVWRLRSGESRLTMYGQVLNIFESIDYIIVKYFSRPLKYTIAFVFFSLQINKSKLGKWSSSLSSRWRVLVRSSWTSNPNRNLQIPNWKLWWNFFCDALHQWNSNKIGQQREKSMQTLFRYQWLW